MEIGANYGSGKENSSLSEKCHLNHRTNDRQRSRYFPEPAMLPVKLEARQMGELTAGEVATTGADVVRGRALRVVGRGVVVVVVGGGNARAVVVGGLL